MADMDETGQPSAFEEDPAAAFLAREQDELGGLVEDTLGFTPGASETGQPLPPTFATGEGAQDEGNLFGYSEPPPMEQPAVQDPYAAVSHMDMTESEPECIKKWKQEQTEMLAQKDAEEQTNLEELKVQARNELAEWYARHEEQLNQTKTLNRQAEAAFVEERDEDHPGTEWERVTRMCDFNPKNSKNTKDVSRMRSIFLQLKQTPPVRD